MASNTISTDATNRTTKGRWMNLKNYLEKLDERFETVEPSSVQKEKNTKRRGSTKRKFGFSSLESKKHPIQKTVTGADE